MEASICEEKSIIMEENFSHAKPMNAYLVPRRER